MARIRGFLAQATVLTAVLLSTTGCIVIDAGGGGWGGHVRFERTVELQQPMQAGSTLVVATSSGSIEVTGQDTDQAHTVATIQARANTEEEAQELAEQVDIRFQESGNRLEIKADMPTMRRNRISISYVITVPKPSSVECDSASGSLKLRDLTGNVTARTASGSAEARGIKGSVRLHSASGSVQGEGLNGGDVDLDTASGGVQLSDATGLGTCRAHSSSGSVRVQHVQADSIRMDTASGGVTGDDLNCTQLKAGSGSGSVSAAFAPTAPNNVVADLGSGSGGINVVLPPEFAGRVDLSAGSGSVHIDRPVTVQGEIGRRHIRGTIGEGTGSLTAHTGSGSIRVR